jgi:hypothetical protein
VTAEAASHHFAGTTSSGLGCRKSYEQKTDLFILSKGVPAKKTG